MKIAIIGSRTLQVNISAYIPQNTDEIISGGAKGIDKIAEVFADENNISKRIIKPNYRKFRKVAPLKRNETIVNMADLIIAIWDEKSRGTRYAIDYAQKAGKPVEVHIISQDKKHAK